MRQPPVRLAWDAANVMLKFLEDHKVIDSKGKVDNARAAEVLKAYLVLFPLHDYSHQEVTLMKYCAKNGTVSKSEIQRLFNCGYIRAEKLYAWIMDQELFSTKTGRPLKAKIQKILDSIAGQARITNKLRFNNT